MSSVARPIFVGQHQRNLDSKNRLTIPSKWRFDGDMEERTLALLDPLGCILIVPPHQVDKIFDDILHRRLSDEEISELQDKLLPMAANVSCDKQGRISLPAEFLAHAGIEKEAIVVGRMVNYRIWSAERWASKDPVSTNQDIGKVMKRVNL